MSPRFLAAPLVGLVLALAVPALAQDAAFDDLGQAWAHVNYEIKDPKAELAAARALAADAEAAARKSPGRAEPLAWQALALLCEADAHHSVASLQLVGRARTLLEHAAAIDANALGPGTIYANLGSIYAELPGFPLSFSLRRILSSSCMASHLRPRSASARPGLPGACNAFSSASMAREPWPWR